MQLFFEGRERSIGVAGGSVEFEPARNEAIGEERLQSFLRRGEIAARGGTNGSGGVAFRCQVEMYGLTFLPIGGDLQDRGAA